MAICAVSKSRISPILRLAQAGQLVLDRVFHRYDDVAHRIQPGERGVQRGGLARARGAGDEHDAVGLADQARKAPQCVALHAHSLQAQLGFALVQQAQHGPLAVGAGQGRDAHVDRACTQAQADAAVLRQAFF